LVFDLLTPSSTTRLVVNQLVGLLGGSYAYYGTTLVTSLFMAMFMVGAVLRSPPFLCALSYSLIM